MNIESNIIRLLGVAQLLVFVASLISERTLVSAAGSGNITEKLISISKSLTLLRISNLVALVTSLGIIVLAVLFYSVFREHNKVIALVAMGLYFAEAITLALSKIGSFAMISLSQKFVEAGSPDSSMFQTMGDFLFNSVDRQGYDIHMLFFCLGGILWYYLFYSSKTIPGAISIWGLVAVGLLTIPTILVLYDRDLTDLMVLGVVYAPYELVLGVWLIVKGFN